MRYSIVIFVVFREWGSDASDQEGESHRTKQEREEEREKKKRKNLIMKEFKKRKVSRNLRPPRGVH